eukprot:TRINITY_DN4155_c0_g1_i2.p1 TRINITY_DN4155_c0_g1~~TRINITY_DN4155_c0_g1_i2.p1  ORF type:complete len:497 (+),score=80.02 TRINITY_DN4155_c0_g1_i2:94-1584(+)
MSLLLLQRHPSLYVLLSIVSLWILITQTSAYNEGSSLQKQEEDHELAEGQRKLIFVMEFCRHGARLPFRNPETLTVFKSTNAEMTEVGLRQHLLIGKQIKHDYIEKHKLLDPDLDLAELYIRSTDTSRTILSARAQLIGMFDKKKRVRFDNPKLRELSIPPMQLSFDPDLEDDDDREDIEEDIREGRSYYKDEDEPLKDGEYKAERLEFVPGFMIPVHTRQVQDETMMPMLGRCVALGRQFERNKFGVPMKELHKGALKSGFYRNFSVHFNLTEYDYDVEMFNRDYDSLYSAKANGVFTGLDIDVETGRYMQFMNSNRDFLVNFGDPATRDLMWTYMANETLDLFDRVIRSEKKDVHHVKFVLYSGHDISLMAMLNALGVGNFTLDVNEYFGEKKSKRKVLAFPPFAAALFLELYKEEREGLKEDEMVFFVRARYEDRYLELPGCEGEEFCAYDIFREILESQAVAAADAKERCKLNYDTLYDIVQRSFHGLFGKS